MKNKFIFLILISTLNAFPAFAEIRCLTLLAGLIKTSYTSKTAYKRSACMINSGELARNISKKLAHEIDLDELNILFIKHRDLSNPFVVPNQIPTLQFLVPHHRRTALMSDSSRFYTTWKYHAVLEFRGLIMDLDFENISEPIPARIYFQKMFPPLSITKIKKNVIDPEGYLNDWGKLHLHKIPAKFYLDHYPKRPDDLDRESTEKLLLLPAIDLEDYLAP